MSEEKYLNATLFEFGNDSKSVMKTIDYINKKFNMNIIVDSDKTKIRFLNVDSAKEWCSHMSTTYVDQGVLVGNNTDSLIANYKLFRINEKLYHIIWYAIEGKIEYDEDKKQWNNYIQKEGAKKAVNSWFDEYGL